MKFAVNDDLQGYIINAYNDGQFTVNGRIFTNSLLITPNRPPQNWDITHVDELTPETIQSLTPREFDTIIMGTGKKLIFPNNEILDFLAKQNIGLEFMDTPAACRTYNILLSEDRKVLAAVMTI